MHRQVSPHIDLKIHYKLPDYAILNKAEILSRVNVAELKMWSYRTFRSSLQPPNNVACCQILCYIDAKLQSGQQCLLCNFVEVLTQEVYHLGNISMYLHLLRARLFAHFLQSAINPDESCARVQPMSSFETPLLKCQVLQDMEAGCVDDYVLRILPMIDSQLFGGVAEEKEAGAFAGTREAKKLRAYDTYQLLAKGITFDKQLATLLGLVSLFTYADIYHHVWWTLLTEDHTGSQSPS